MRVVLIDTSLMLDCVNLKIDVFTELDRLMEGVYELRIPSGVLHELDEKKKGGGKKARDASVAFALLEQRAAVEPSKGKVDDWLVKRGAELNAVVCTNDSELRRRLKDAGVSVISVRNRSQLDYA
ncbi:DNA-binding protein [Candidatus Micrarchaeota archaeon]|nr:MAG: DNA-binding protein [Candidatus Micrarchaeota archaeon]